VAAAPLSILDAGEQVAGIDAAPNRAPAIARAIAATVSVSPPQLTAATIAPTTLRARAPMTTAPGTDPEAVTV
jgi:hypothetical protein